MMRVFVVATLATVAALVLTVGTQSVPAAVPGHNGVILVLRHDPRVDNDTVLYEINPDGTHFHRVIPGAVTATECPHWSPDGTSIAVCGSNPGEAAVIIDADGDASHTVSSPDPSLNLACTVWSADGGRLACGNFDVAADPDRDGLYTLRSSDGHRLRRLTSNPGGYDEPGDYSPDGAQIVFLRSDPNRPPEASQAHFIVNIDGTDLHRISPWSDSSDSNGQSSGSWSPDGTLILYGNRRHLFTVRPDGTGLRRIPLNTSGFTFPFAPEWSPDGTLILFGLFHATGPGTGVEGIYTANPDGSRIRVVRSTSTSSPKYQFEEPGGWGTHPPVE
jgi:Tol biopolymer transport system component